jgi:hypothetical protein
VNCEEKARAKFEEALSSSPVLSPAGAFQNHLFLGRCSAIISFAQNQPIAEAHSGSFWDSGSGGFNYRAGGLSGRDPFGGIYR